MTATETEADNLFYKIFWMVSFGLHYLGHAHMGYWVIPTWSNLENWEFLCGRWSTSIGIAIISNILYIIRSFIYLQNIQYIKGTQKIWDESSCTVYSGNLNCTKEIKYMYIIIEVIKL